MSAAVLAAEPRGGEGWTAALESINATPTWVLRTADGTVDQVVWLEIVAGQIGHLRVVRNPDKLAVLRR